MAWDLRECFSTKGSSLSSKRLMKKSKKEKGVTERILHLRAPKITFSILSIIWASKNSPSTWKSHSFNIVQTLINTLEHVHIVKIQSFMSSSFSYRKIRNRHLWLPHFSRQRDTRKRDKLENPGLWLLLTKHFLKKTFSQISQMKQRTDSVGRFCFYRHIFTGQESV